MPDTEYIPVPFALSLQLKIRGNLVIGNLNGGAHNAEFAWTANGGLDAVHADLRSAFQVIDRVALAQVCAKFWFEQTTQTPKTAPAPKPSEPSQESEVRSQRLDFLTWLEQNRFTLDLKLMRDSQHIWFRHTNLPEVLFQVYYEGSTLVPGNLRGWYLKCDDTRNTGPHKDTYPIQYYLSFGQPAIGPQGAIPDLEPPATPAESQKHILEAQEALNMPTDLAMTRAKTRLDQFLKYRDDIRADPPPNFSHIDHKIDHFLLGLRYLAFEKRVTAFMEHVDKALNTPRLNDMVFGPNPAHWAPPVDRFGKDDT